MLRSSRWVRESLLVILVCLSSPDLLGTRGHLCMPDHFRVVETYPVHSVPAGGQGPRERTANYHHISLSVGTCYTLWQVLLYSRARGRAKSPSPPPRQSWLGHSAAFRPEASAPALDNTVSQRSHRRCHANEVAEGKLLPFKGAEAGARGDASWTERAGPILPGGLHRGSAGKT